MKYAKEFAIVFGATVAVIFILRRVVQPSVPQVAQILGSASVTAAPVTTV